MRERTLSSRFLIPACIAFLCLLLIGLIYYSKYQTGDGISRLRKMSAFKVDEKLLDNFIRGQLSICSDQPEPEVGTYPAFKSGKPLYGTISLAEEYGRENSGISYHYAVDESQGTGQGYDRLYFDHNRDLDLTNDEPRVPLKSPPQRATWKNPYIKQQICFHSLEVDFENGAAGRDPLKIMPRLMIFESGHANLSFVTTEARKGRIRIAGRRYDVFLGHNYLVSGGFDRPWTALHLIQNGDMGKQLHWQGADRLMAVHKIDGTYYCFSATPAGDQLIAQPYEDKLGTFMGGSGGRNITYIGCSGSLCSQDKAAVIGGNLAGGWPGSSPQSQLPIGDYLPLSLTIQYDKLSVYLSDNYHADGKPRSRASTDKKYTIKIREDKPFIFDFSNKPEVVFASPEKDYRIKPGEELSVKAVLTDPELDIMIRRLSKMKKGSGSVSLDPKVIITRADGEKVAEGLMPFG